MNLHDKIDLYIDNRLSPQEKADFFEELKVNKVLKKEFDERIEFHNLMKKYFSYPYELLDIEELEELGLTKEDEINIMEDIEYSKELDDKTKNKSVKSFLSLFKEIHKPRLNRSLIITSYAAWVAAAVIFIVFFTLSGYYAFNYIKFNKKSEIAYQKYYAPHENSFIQDHAPDFITITNSGFVLDRKIEIPDYYKYDEVVRGSSSQNMNMVYFAFLKAQNEEEEIAIQSLEQFLEYNQPYAYPVVDYYYALLLLKRNDFRRAINILTELEDMNHSISIKASEVLKVLNNS